MHINKGTHNLYDNIFYKLKIQFLLLPYQHLTLLMAKIKMSITAYMEKVHPRNQIHTRYFHIAHLNEQSFTTPQTQKILHLLNKPLS